MTRLLYAFAFAVACAWTVYWGQHGHCPVSVLPGARNACGTCQSNPAPVVAVCGVHDNFGPIANHKPGD